MTVAVGRIGRATGGWGEFRLSPGPEEARIGQLPLCRGRPGRMACVVETTEGGSGQQPSNQLLLPTTTTTCTPGRTARPSTHPPTHPSRAPACPPPTHPPTHPPRMGMVSSTSASGPCFISPARMPSLCISATSLTCSAVQRQQRQQVLEPERQPGQRLIISSEKCPQCEAHAAPPTTQAGGGGG